MRSIAVLVLVLAGCLSALDDTGGAGSPPPNTDPQAGCAGSCHGNEQSNAPPVGLTGSTDPATVGIGAHAQHMNPAPAWHRPVACADCHRVPAEVASPGHMDDADRKAEITFSTLAGATAMWTGTSCTTGCHGSPAWGGTATQPVWTTVDGTQAACGSCHGTPPPPPHPTGASNCASCHPSMEDNSLSFRDPSLHINGVIDVVGANETGGCTGTCHGSTNAAPPKALDGSTARTSPGVGAHQQHLATSTWRRDIACSECHTVPATVDAPGHRDGDNIAEITFGTLNAAGTYTKATTTCASQYCHGTGRGSTGTISWLATGPLACTGCHATNGTGMSGDHRKHIVGEGMKCSQCHAGVVDANMNVLAPALHINGVHEVKMARGTYNAATRACTNTGCHGTETW